MSDHQDLRQVLARHTGPGPVLVVGTGVPADDVRRTARSNGRTVTVAGDVVAAARAALDDAPALTVVTAPYLTEPLTGDGPGPADRRDALTTVLDNSAVVAVDTGARSAADAADLADLFATFAGHRWFARAGQDRTATSTVLLDRVPHDVAQVVADYERTLAATAASAQTLRTELLAERHQGLRVRDHLMGLEVTTGTARRDLAATSRENERLRRDNEALSAQVAAMRASSTWRIGDAVLRVPRRALGR